MKQGGSAVSPIDTYLSHKTEQSERRRQADVQAWQAWKTAPEEHKPALLQPLLSSYMPTFHQKEQQWRPPSIPKSAFMAQLQHHFVGALHDYDPEKAALSTHVDMRLKKALRYVGKHQNIAYIPEGQTQHIGKIQRARDQLKDELGRDPTTDEIGDHLGMTPKRITTIMGSMKKDLPSSLWESDPVAQASSREQQVLGLIRYELAPDEQSVFDHIYGHNGAQRIEDTGQLARKLGKSPSQISRLKTSIIDKYNKFR